MGDQDQSAPFCGSLSGERVRGGRNRCPWMELAIRHGLMPVITQLCATRVTRLKVGSTGRWAPKRSRKHIGLCWHWRGRPGNVTSQRPWCQYWSRPVPWLTPAVFHWAVSPNGENQEKPKGNKYIMSRGLDHLDGATSIFGSEPVETFLQFHQEYFTGRA
jgi:hypothetical protein